MKKVFITLLMIWCISMQAWADVIPYKVSDIPVGTLGVYQSTNGLRVYSNPDKKSNILFDKKWSYLTINSTDYVDSLFALLLTKKELAYVYANDIDEDFVQVIYNKKLKLNGWAYKEDDFQFLPWITFYNMYGRKYGLKLLKDSPMSVLNVHSRSDKESQIIGKLNRPKEIRFTTIQGNWALVTALNIDNSVCTGFIQWRGENGELYYFPAIK